MDQTIWNTLHGRFFSLTGDYGTISRFSIHGDIILALLAPLYLIWDNVRAILIFQSFALALGAIPIYLISFKLLKNKILALLLAAMYLLNPGMQWTNIYDFHPIALVIPFLLSTFYCALTKKWRWYFAFLILSLMTKEEVGFTTMIMGGLLLIMFKEWKIGLITIAISGFWIFVVVRLIIPHYNIDHTYSYSSWYKIAEENIKSTNLIEIPNELVRNYFVTIDTIPYYNILLREFAFLPLLGIPWILLSLPELLINIFSSHAQMRSIVLHYDSLMVPGLMISSIFTIYYLQIFFSKVKYLKKYSQLSLYFITCVALAIVIRVDYHYSPLPITPSCWCKTYRVTKNSIAFEKILQKIPKSASVTSSPEIAPHTTHRENAYTLPIATASADFIAMSDQNRIIGDNNPKGFENELIKVLQGNDNFELVSHIHHYYLFKRK